VRVELTNEERQIASRAATALGLNVSGVDMVRSSHGPLVMEVNSSPGLEGIEGASGIDIASRIIDFLEQNASYGKTATKGVG
jgi:ribosomal protein S6--L-glutamate ligase